GVGPGDVILVNVAATTGLFADFYPSLQLLGGQGQLIADRSARISLRLTNAGPYTALVSANSFQFRPRSYAIFLGRGTEACNAVAVSCGRRVAVTEPPLGGFATFLLPDVGLGDTILLNGVQSHLPFPQLVLYDLEGREIASMGGQTILRL